MAKLPMDQEALEALEAAATEDETSRSAYWDRACEGFSVKADGEITGTSVLGSISRKARPMHRLAHRVLQWPFRLMGHGFPAYADSETLGRLVARRQNRQFTHDMIRQVLSLALVRRYVNLDLDSECNLVIGDGYGVLTSLFLLATPHRRTILVNLTKPLLLDMVSIRQSVPDARFVLVDDAAQMQAALRQPDIRLIAVRADNAPCIAEAPVGVAMNVVSMQEMPPPAIAEYFQILRRNKAAKTAFYCCNKLYKRLSDGTELLFSDYPWHPGDDILHDSVCPWSQWYYDKAPPFWHHRSGERRVIWHRLALLQKAVS